MQEELETGGTVGTMTRQPCTYSRSGRKFLWQSEQAEGSVRGVWLGADCVLCSPREEEWFFFPHGDTRP